MGRVAVVMAGGSGERFWPLSRERRPKQLLRLTSPDRTMLEEAIERAEAVVGTGHAYLSTNRALAGLVAESGLLPQGRILAEPARKNTLGALVWASSCLIAAHPADWQNLSVAVLTADHRIADPNRFAEAARVAMAVAERQNGLVTIGIKPTQPSTGFGYVEPDRARPVPNLPVAAFRATSFREKPAAEDAARYVDRGFLWNSGMFFWTLGAFHDALQRAEPRSGSLLDMIVGALRAGDMAKAEEAFGLLPSLSVDVAVMERAERVYVVEGAFGWDDVGSWDALDRTLPKDGDGNVLVGQTIAEDSRDSIVYNASSGAVACVLGVEGLVVVATDDAVLVLPKSRAQDVKRMVEQLKERDSSAL